MAKKKGGGANQKVDVKKREKVVQDKTFGLKNKNKSKKVQQYVAGVKSQVMDTPAAIAARKKKEQIKNAKLLQAAKDRELSMMFKTVQAKPKAGHDSKSVICAYFKQGLCKRGDKCKFSHNLEQVRKVAKLDLYADPRYVTKPDERENKTNIICKFFLEAAEKKQYGALWICPNNGNNCQYNHCLPEGYVLMRDRKKVAEADTEIPLEEQIEIDRSTLLKRTDLTPLTKESFEKWKIEQKQKAKNVAAAKVKAAMENKKSGGTVRLDANALSGRDLFTYDPSLFVDDADAADDAELEIRGLETDEKKEDDVKTPEVKDESLFLDDEDVPSDDD